jgi:hypothetical protein
MLVCPTACRVHPQEAHGNGAAAAAGGQAAAAFKHQQQKQPPPRPPSPTEVAELLYNNWLVDVPKMLDIAVLYGPSNSKLTAQWLQQLLLLQPKYAQVQLQAKPVPLLERELWRLPPPGISAGPRLVYQPMWSTAACSSACLL